MKTEAEFLAALLRYFGLNEAVRSDQSYEGLKQQIEAALNTWSDRPANDLCVRWTFSDRVIATAWVEKMDGAEWHAWEIAYSQSDAGGIVFGKFMEVKQVQLFEPAPMTESKKAGRTFTETIEQVMTLTEAASGARKVKAIGITADVVNGNARRYPRAVVANAVAKLNGHLHESNGQGRFIATGEVEHPTDKGGRPNLLETVVKWEAASLDSTGKVLLEGVILPTGKGKDISILIEHGVPIGVSMRGYGDWSLITESGQTIQQVTDLTIKGFDLVAQPSDPNGQVTESAQAVGKEEVKKTMNLEELLKQLKDDPAKLAEFLKANPALIESVVGELGYADKRQLAGVMGVSPARIEQSLQEAMQAKQELEERKRTEALDKAIEEACKDLPYGEQMNKQFMDSIRSAKPESPEAVLKLVESKTKEWDGIFAATRLAGMGKGVQVMGPVFERETGQPEYTRSAWELNESLVRSGNGKRRDLRKAETKAEIYARLVLERFDLNYRQQMLAESKLFQEAETTTDLNLPYTVSRTIIEQAFPELIAANVFDFGVASASPERLYFETYAGESGSSATVTDEVVTGDHGAWVTLAHARLQPGTVVLTDSGGSTTYEEGTDYVVNYVTGALMTLAAGATTDSQSLKIDYTYDAIRKGENTEIERAKTQLSYMTMEIAADRLAIQITNEAVVFSRSQLGYDAVGRTLSNLIREIRRIIDRGVIYRAIAASLQQANNSGGTWASGSDPIAELVEKVGIAKTKVYNRFYMPTSILMSQTNADRLSNWDGFTRLGFDNATLNAAGFAGSIKGLPIFATPEMSDKYILTPNRELVMHRVYQAMMLKGPFPSFSNGKLVAADQWYTEEFNGTEVPVVEKVAHVVVS